MKGFFKKIIFSVSFASTAFFTFAPAVALAIPHPEDPYGLKITVSRTPYSDPATSSKTLPELIGGFIGVLLSFVGLVFLCLSIYGGYKWMTAGGNEEPAKEARETLVNAAIGILLIVCAYVLTDFLFSNIVTAVTTDTTATAGADKSVDAAPPEEPAAP